MKSNAAKHGSSTPKDDVNALTASLLGIEETLVAGGFSPNEGIDEILTTIHELESVTSVVIALPSGRSFVVFDCVGAGLETGGEIHLANQLYWHCVTEARMALCEDSRKDDRLTAGDKASIGSALLLPLRSSGSVMGVLGVFSDKPGALGRQHILPFSTAASLIEVLLGRVERRSAEVPQADNSKTGHPTEVSGPGPTKVVAMPIAEPRPLSGDPSAVKGKPRQQKRRDLGAAAAVPEPAKNPRVEDDIRAILLAASAKNEPGENGTDQSKKTATAMTPRVRWALAGGLLLCAVLIGTMIILLSSETPAKAKDVAPPTVPSSIHFSFDDPVLSQPASGHNRGKIVSGRVIVKKQPEYPVEALENRVEGNVDAVLMVDDRGIVYDLKIADAGQGDRDQLLSNAVMASFSHWRFAPFTLNGDNVGVKLPVHVSFKIRQETGK